MIIQVLEFVSHQVMGKQIQLIFRYL